MTGSNQRGVMHLRPATPDDKRMIYDALARSDLTDILLGHPGQNHTRLLRWDEFCGDYLPNYFDDTNPHAGRCFVIEVDGEAVGQVNYNPIDTIKRRTELDIWMLSAAQCGRGFGPEALRTLCYYLSACFGVEEFVIAPSASNRRAIRAYEKAGFRRTSLSREEAEAEYDLRESDALCMIRRIELLEPPPLEGGWSLGRMAAPGARESAE